MGCFNLAVKGLYAGSIYFGAIFFLDSAFPGNLAATAFSIPGIAIIMLLLIFEMFFDFAKPPGAGGS